MKLGGCLSNTHTLLLLRNQIGMKKPLRVAFISIFLWSTQSVFMSKGTTLTDFSAILFPSFLISSLFFFIFKVFHDGEDFISELIKPILKKWRHFLIGSSLIFGSHLFFYWGIQKGPKVESSLTNFLWPLLFIILGYLIFNEKFLKSKSGENFISKIKLITGNGSLVFEPEKRKLDWLRKVKVTIGFLGVTLLLTHGNISQFNLTEWQGPILGFFGGLLWAIFSIYLRFLGKTSYITLFINGTAVLSGFFWIYRGCPNILPTLSIATYLGLLPMGLAMLTWERAMKYGRTQEIGTLAFLAPLLSSIFLYLAKYDYLNRYSLIGGRHNDSI